MNQRMNVLAPPRHGADLAAASERYGIPLSDWLDLSTGINPCAYPLCEIDVAAWHELPYSENALRIAAQVYAQSPALPVVAAGSQALIQWLPIVRKLSTDKTSRVAVPAIGYAEHAFRWQWAGHELIHYDPRDANAIDALLGKKAVDVLVVINAHNPLGTLTAPEQLLKWREQLANNSGWLIVDEAFVDPTPEYSVVSHTHLPGLIVLRSLGKFFGLAGARCGFAFCEPSISDALQIAVGPWPLSGPTLAVATAALRDQAWQKNMRARLQAISAANADALQHAFATPVLSHALFNSVVIFAETAIAVEDRLAQQGIRVRRIEIDGEKHLLRFGPVDPENDSAWSRFQRGLRVIQDALPK